ncbi:MAG: maleylpyruvate isomerase N-terminal domain-containing protein [Acidimicrobiales bacterium]
MNTAASIESLLTDLAAEHAALDDVVAAIDDDAWDTPTPAAAWTVRDQIGHLAFFDAAAARAVRDPAGFAAERDVAMAGLGAYMARAEGSVRQLPPVELLAEWRSGRGDMLGAFEPLDATARIEWYGPTMSARSFLTARLMETWAHGLDVADGLGVAYPATPGCGMWPTSVSPPGAGVSWCGA